MHCLTVCNQCFKWNVSRKVRGKGFLSPGKPWNLVFASPGKSWKKAFECMYEPCSIVFDFLLEYFVVLPWWRNK